MPSIRSAPATRALRVARSGHPCVCPLLRVSKVNAPQLAGSKRLTVCKRRSDEL